MLKDIARPILRSDAILKESPELLMGLKRINLSVPRETNKADNKPAGNANKFFSKIRGVFGELGGLTRYAQQMVSQWRSHIHCSHIP